MSYDISLVPGPPCEHCGRSDPRIDGPDPTYNLTPIFDKALTEGGEYPNPEISEGERVVFCASPARPRGLCLLSGRKVGDTREQLMAALNYLKNPEHEKELVALEPENKWGDLEGAIEVMGILLQLALENPEHTWEVY